MPLKKPKPRPFVPIATRVTPTELESAVQMSLPSTIAQIPLEEVVESQPEPATRTMAFAPAPTPQDVEAAAEARRKREGEWSWGLWERWKGMVAGLAEGSGLEQATTTAAMVGLPGNVVIPAEIASLKRQGKLEEAQALKAAAESSRDRALNTPYKEQYADIVKGYDEMEADIQHRNRDNPFVLNAVTDVGEVVASLPALIAETFLPKQIKDDETEFGVGKDFGKLFGGAAIGGTGEIIRHPIDSFTARPVMTLTAWFPMLRAGYFAGKSGLRWRKLQKAGEEATQATAQAAASKAVETGYAAQDTHTFLTRWLADGLAQGNPAATALVEDIMLNPRKAEARVKSLVSRAQEQIRKEGIEPTDLPVGEMQPPPAVVTEYTIEAGKLVPETTKLGRLYESSELIAQLTRKADSLNSTLELTRTWLEELGASASEGANVKADLTKANQSYLTAEAQLKQTNKQIADIHKGAEYKPAGGGRTEPRSWMTSNRNYEKILDTIYSEVVELLPEGTDRRQFGLLFNDTMSRRSVQLFKDFKFRKKVADWVAKRAQKNNAIPAGWNMRRKFSKEINKILEDHAKRSGMGGEEFPVITAGDVVVFDRTMLPHLTRRLEKGRSPIDMREVTAEVIGRVGEELATQVYETNLKRGLESEATRLYPPEVVNNPSAYGAEIAEAILVRGETAPQLLKLNPAEVAGGIRANITALANKLLTAGMGQKKGFVIRDIEAKLLKLADDLEQYTAVDEKLGGYYATPNFAGTLGWTLKANESLRSGAWLRKFDRFMRGNITARNIPTHINNWLSNVGMIMMRRGDVGDPVRFTLKPLREYNKFKKGELTDPFLIEMYEAIESTHLLDTDLVDAELGAVMTSFGETPGIGFIKKHTWDKVNRALEHGYKYWGDGALKLEETTHNYKLLNKHYDEMQPGQYIRYQRTPRQKIHLQKTEWGFRDMATGKILSKKELAKITAEGAMEPALGVFMDYGDRPLALQALQTAPILGIASPFFTWSAKAIDIPGVKRGLVSRALEGGLMVETNNKTILARQSAEAGRVSLVRSMLVNGMREELERYKDIAKLWKWIPSGTGQAIIMGLTNPAYYMGMDFTSASWAGPTELLFRGTSSAWVDITYDDEEIEYLFPKNVDWDEMPGYKKEEVEDIKRRRKLWGMHERGELWNASQSLELIGLAGSPILRIVQHLQDTEDKTRQGLYREFRWSEMYKKFGALLIGGTWHRVLDVSMGAMDDYADLSSRNWAISKDNRETEDFIRWAIRRATSKGWNTKNVETRGKKWFSDRKSAWKASLVNPIKTKREKETSEWERLQREGAPPEELKKRAEFISGLAAKESHYNDIIASEMAQMEEKYYRLLNRTQAK